MSMISRPITIFKLPKLLWPEFDRFELSAIEPGLLAVFRLVVILQIAVLLSGLVLQLVFERSIEWHLGIFLSLGGLLFLLGYLCWPQLGRTLGRLYLPLALLIVTVVPILTRAINIYTQMQTMPTRFTELEMMSFSWRMYVALLVPLVLIAWQYPLRWVMLCSVGMNVFGQALSLWLFGSQFFQLRDLREVNIAGAIMYLIIGYIIVRMISAQRQQRQALLAAHIKLADYAFTAEELAVSRERNRLARDLHDTLAHTLSGAAIQLEAADSAWEKAPDQAHALLIQVLTAMRSGLNETRRVVQALRASPLDDLGLALAIRALAESTATRSGARLTLDLVDDIDLSPDLEQNLYRITQEALANITEHANAQKIRIMLGRLNNALVLVITDDGSGFSINNPAQDGHYGLQGMYERAKLIGATLTIKSEPGQGTTVQLDLPQSPRRAAI